MGGIGVAVEELDGVIRAGFRDRLVNLVLNRDRAHRDRAIRQRLGHCGDIRRDAENLAGERLAQAAEAGDDLIEHKQNAVLVADLAQPLQIAGRRHQRPGGPGDRLDKNRRDGRTAIGLAMPLQIVGEFDAVLLRLAIAEKLVAREGVAQHDDVRHGHRKCLAVLHHAGEAHAADIHPVIGPFAADETQALGLAARAVIGHDDLERGVDRLGPGIDEEHVVERVGQQRRHAPRQIKRCGMSDLEGWRIRVRRQLLVDRIRDFLARVAGWRAEQAGGAVDHAAPMVIRVVHAFGGDHHPGLLLEVPIAGERHPVLFEGVRALRGARSEVFHDSITPGCSLTDVTAAHVAIQPRAGKRPAAMRSDSRQRPHCRHAQ